MDDKKCCGTCLHHRKYDGEWVCFNEQADAYAVETDYADGNDCNEWEER